MMVQRLAELSRGSPDKKKEVQVGELIRRQQHNASGAAIMTAVSMDSRRSAYSGYPDSSRGAAPDSRSFGANEQCELKKKSDRAAATQ